MVTKEEISPKIKEVINSLIQTGEIKNKEIMQLVKEIIAAFRHGNFNFAAQKLVELKLKETELLPESQIFQNLRESWNDLKAKYSAEGKEIPEYVFSLFEEAIKLRRILYEKLQRKEPLTELGQYTELYNQIKALI